MAINSKDITPQESIKEQLADFILEAGTHYADSSREAVEKMLKHLKNKRVIDLGCGDGAATQFFQEAKVKVIGVDVNSEKLKLNPTKTIEQDVISYMKEQKAIPNIFMHHALEHLPNPQELLDLIPEKLVKGGIVYIEVPAGDHIHGPHHSTFDSPDDILPPNLEELERGTTDAHYIIARKK